MTLPDDRSSRIAAEITDKLIERGVVTGVDGRGDSVFDRYATYQVVYEVLEPIINGEMENLKLENQRLQEDLDDLRER